MDPWWTPWAQWIDVAQQHVEDAGRPARSRHLEVRGELGERLLAPQRSQQQQDGARGVGENIVSGHLTQGHRFGGVARRVRPPAQGQVDHGEPGQGVEHHHQHTGVPGLGQQPVEVRLGAVELAEVERSDAQVREQLVVLGKLLMDARTPGAAARRRPRSHRRPRG